MRRAWPLLGCLLACWAAAAQAEPLASWRDGECKRALLRFVTDATTQGGPRWIAPDDRVAVFDNDGTLWSEQPLYFQALFALDRLRELGPKHPEWRRDPLLKAALDGDEKTLAAGGHAGMLAILAATHAGMTSDEFDVIVARWLATAKHPRFGRPYTELVFVPMLELLAYLRANGFHTFIVSGGGADFMRAFAQRVYGIPPWQVVGSRLELKDERRGQEPVLVRLPKVDFIDDGPAKPIGIETQIGVRPVFAAGNSDGDLEMLEWTTAKGGARLGLLVHHTDASREWAYDRDSKVGKLERALEEAPRRGWLVVDMKRDWKRVYAFDPGSP